MPESNPTFDRGPMHRATESAVKVAAQRVVQRSTGRHEVTLTLEILFRPAGIGVERVVSAEVGDCSNTRAIVNALHSQAKQHVDDVIDWYEPNDDVTSGMVKFLRIEVTEVS